MVEGRLIPLVVEQDAAIGTVQPHHQYGKVWVNSVKKVRSLQWGRLGTWYSLRFGESDRGTDRSFAMEEVVRLGGIQSVFKLDI